ncbi:MerR family transcriptional regulator [Brevibacillus humidisoli]|uniref:MerR family transcriptional regulator n=1 Tax=Brevibacillus humidisoli TaxID=2895522 RepID=UPI001E3AAD34|nr:MerR family transcriptional regulator [Brevibacillus humidisoli]UFJ42959.1 MerR family transcriptional regulator [Brevibacillus humidisoli]
MKIKELAEYLQTTPRAIRFYEEKGLLAPYKDPESGYRCFTEEDAWRLQTIIALREVGVPIEAIRQLLAHMEQGSEEVRPYLELQLACMYDRWLELKAAIQTTERMIERLNQEQMLDPCSLYELADANKRLRQTRQEWSDRWNFDLQADQYDELVTRKKKGFNPHDGYTQVLNRVVSLLQPQAHETGLDAGTGTGNLAKMLIGRCQKVCALDQSMEMLKKCKQKNPSAETKLGNFLAIPYLDHSFDFVATSYALHHLTDEQKRLALAEFARVLKPNGRLVIADLMFHDQADRERHLLRLRQAGREVEANSIEDEYYADRSLLISELDRLGFDVEAEQLNTYLHVISARRRTDNSG